MRRRVVVAVAVCAVVVGSCDAGPLEDGGTEPVGDPGESTAAVAPIESVALLDEIDCPNFLADGEDRSTRRSFNGLKLEGDARRLRDYGWAHPDVFGGLHMVRDPTRLEVGFTTDIDEHCSLMRDLVKRPNGFDVIRVAYSIADKQAAAEVAALAGASPIPVDWRPVEVRLHRLKNPWQCP